MINFSHNIIYLADTGPQSDGDNRTSKSVEDDSPLLKSQEAGSGGEELRENLSTNDNSKSESASDLSVEDKLIFVSRKGPAKNDDLELRALALLREVPFLRTAFVFLRPYLILLY